MANAEIEMIRAFLAASPAPQSIAELRALYDGMGSQFPTAADVTLEAVSANGVPAEWSRPPGAASDAALLYLHGGGYVIGSIASHRHVASELGRAAGIPSLAIDYRMAPENPFPAAVDDALAAYRWLLGQGIAANRIAVAGDSAGGGLSVALLLAIKAAGLPQPACAVPISPWVDMAATGGTMDSKAASDPMVQKQALLDWAGLYLGATAASHPLASPIHGDLAGIAPLLIQVGSEETLLDDALMLAARAGHAQVPVTLEIAPEMIHVWHFFHPMLGEARAGVTTPRGVLRGPMR
jgi:monoterpene epsilon-lactone hydrolase